MIQSVWKLDYACVPIIRLLQPGNLMEITAAACEQFTACQPFPMHLSWQHALVLLASYANSCSSCGKRQSSSYYCGGRNPTYSVVAGWILQLEKEGFKIVAMKMRWWWWQWFSSMPCSPLQWSESSQSPLITRECEPLKISPSATRNSHGPTTSASGKATSSPPWRHLVI